VHVIRGLECSLSPLSSDIGLLKAAAAAGPFIVMAGPFYWHDTQPIANNWPAQGERAHSNMERRREHPRSVLSVRPGDKDGSARIAAHDVAFPRRHPFVASADRKMC
jgi:hypothetical protein